MGEDNVFRAFAISRAHSASVALKRELAQTTGEDRQPLLARLRDVEACLSGLQQVPTVRRDSVVLRLVAPDEERPGYERASRR
jgi:hypothetical protein